MDLMVDSDGCAAWGAHVFRAALGRAGIARHKREGDHATPQGEFLLREVLYRPDRVAIPRTRLPFRALERDDGWCAERLWRDDHVYDLLAPLGYNDDPVVPGLGSAIFLHLAGPNYPGTEGCIGLALEDLLMVLEEADARSRVVVRD